MYNTTKEIMVFIQSWIYRLDKSTKLTVFVGLEAVYNTKQELYCVGAMEYKFVAKDIPQLADAHPGDRYKIKVKEEQDPQYGYQLRVVSAERVESAEVHEIKKFITQQIKEKSLTHKRRDALIEAHGTKIFDAVRKNSSALDIFKADPNIKRRIRCAMMKNKGFADLLAFLKKQKWDCRWASPLYETYKDKAILSLLSDPYLLYQQELAGFRAADRVFLESGRTVNDPLRCWHAVLAALEREEKNGGTFIPRKELRERITSLLWDNDSGSNLAISEGDISMALDWLEVCKQIHIDHVDGREDVYLLPLYHAEVLAAEGLSALCQAKKAVTCSAQEIDQFLVEYRSTNGAQLTSTQRMAVKQMLTAPVSVITGGPGTGKTMIIKAAIDTLHELYPQAVVQCCAPTGKAAGRMPAEASTIDRLAESEKWKQVYKICKEDADIFFVDEVSMVGIGLFSKLLTMVSAGSRLVLIGDKDQLPSIAAGQVLHDLIESGVIRTIRLQERFRQKEDSSIPAIAEKTIHTAADEDIKLDEKGADFAFNKYLSNPHRIPRAVIQAAEMVQQSGIPLKDTPVICRTRNGECGTRNMNRIMQEHFNHQGGDENRICYGGKKFQLNDPVIHTKNNYNLDVMNGEVGVIIEINHTKEHALTIQYPSKTVKYAEEYLEELDLAYALTAHKCQGSEYRAVIIPIVDKGISRRWLYTAETRGKELVLMLGTESALTAEMRGETTDERASRFALRLKKLLPAILPEVEQISLFPAAEIKKGGHIEASA